MDARALPPPWLPKQELTDAQRAALKAIGVNVSPPNTSPPVFDGVGVSTRQMQEGLDRIIAALQETAGVVEA
jgi:hypothetical protein